MISIRGLRKVYPQGKTTVTALESIDLDIPAGTIHGIIGPSGSGKSTLVRCLTLLDEPTSGTIEVNGTVLTGAKSSELRSMRRRVGLVFQHGNLLSSRTALQNVMLPLEVTRAKKDEARAKAEELLGLVGLESMMHRYPAQLSGGQRQRVGIARALAADPDVLLADEPTAALDPSTTDDILELIRDVTRRLGLTALVITHEMKVVKALCDSVSLLDEGRLVETGNLADVATDTTTVLGQKLMPLDLAEEPAGPVLSVVGVQDMATVPASPVLVEAGFDPKILSATTETLGSVPLARWIIDLSNEFPDQTELLDALRRAGDLLSERGFTANVITPDASASVPDTTTNTTTQEAN